MIPALLAAGGGVIGVLEGLWLARRPYVADESRQRVSGAWLAVLGLLVAISWAGLVWRLGAQPASLAMGLEFAAVGAAASWIDVDVHRIPDRLVIAGVSLAVVVAVVSCVGGVAAWTQLLVALGGGLAVLVVFGVVALFTSVGWGDVKWLGFTGFVLAWSSPTTLLVGLVAAGIYMGVVAAIALLSGMSRQAHIPLAPMLTAGALTALMLV